MITSRDVAILCRTRRQIESVQEALTRQNIPTNTKGAQPFFDFEEIKNIMGMFQWVVNPDDMDSLARFSKGFSTGAGQTTIYKLYNSHFISKHPTFEDMKTIVEGDKAKRQKKLLPMIDLALRAKNENWTPRRMVDEMERQFNMLLKLKKTDLHSNIKRCREDSLLTLVDKCTSAGEITLEEFVDQCSLVNLEDDNEDGITITTIHKAKGLEWPIVFVMGVSEGLIPHDLSMKDAQEIEQERNLLYVAMTRAKNHLFMTHADEMEKFNSTVQVERSRFVSDVIPKIKAIGKVHLTKPVHGNSILV